MASSPADAGDPVELYRTMARIRWFETRVGQRFRAGDIHGFVHVSLGQEAVAAGACAALRDDDYITTTHRGHGHCIAKGASPLAMFAELLGRSTGICRGKGGSMHIADPRLGILGANGIVGAGIPIAAGAALAAKIRGSGQVAVAFFGEGAVHCGAFHEGSVLAAAWGLPLILFCENNGYAEFTKSDRWGGPSVTERAAAYGIAADRIDGSDAVAVHERMIDAVAAARDGAGPLLIEATTTRFSGHYEGDAQPYRDPDELASLEAHDPLRVLRDRVGDAAADEIEESARSEIDDAVAEAMEAPLPDDDAVFEDIYA